MANFFIEGGYGMFPTLALGVLLVGASVWYASRPARPLLALLATLGTATLACGVLGTVSGMAMVGRFVATVAPDDRLKIIMLGWQEASHNMTLALSAIVLASVVAAVGALRLARGERVRAAGVATANG